MLQNAIILLKTHLALIYCHFSNFSKNTLGASSLYFFFLSKGRFKRMSSANLNTWEESNIFNEILSCKGGVARIKIKMEN